MFDPKCHEMAEYFLDGEAEVTPDEVNKLAQHLQDEIESWLHARDPALKDRWETEGWDKSGIGYGDGTAVHESIENT